MPSINGQKLPCENRAISLIASNFFSRSSFRYAKFVLASLLFVTTASAQETKDDHLLDGTSIEWAYTSGAGMILSFDNGLAQYEWITGARKGRSAEDIPYKSREIGDNVYLINWVQPEKPDFITLIFDFNENLVFSSGLIGYGTERQKNLFLDGTVQRLKR